GSRSRSRRLYWCSECTYEYSVTAGTIFHDSRIPLSMWFLAISILLHRKEKVSAKTLQRVLGVSYETAWSMARRIRSAVKTNPEFCQRIADLYTAHVLKKWLGWNQV